MRSRAHERDESTPDYSNVPEADGDMDETESVPTPLETTVRTAPGRLPATAELRTRILADPLVQQTIELFDGAVVNMERLIPPTAADEADTTE